MTDLTLDKLKAVVADYFSTPVGRLSGATTADDVDGWDSVAHAMLVLEIEDEFGITLQYEEAIEAENLSAFAALIDRKKSTEA